MKEVQMEVQTHVAGLLEKYNVDAHRGFLPHTDPLQRLPSHYDAWETLADNFTAYINAGVIREKIDELVLIEAVDFSSSAEKERAMMLLSFFAHAYVHYPSEPRKYIPASVSIPWIKLSNELKRKPVISHAMLVLHNWRRLDTTKPIQLDNLATLCQFHGGLDESWFYLVTVEIEAVGAKAIPLLLEAMKFVEAEQFSEATHKMNDVLGTLQSLTSILKKMYVHCDPHIFYTRVRHFVASFEQIEYRGTELPLQSMHGGSAAQSSLLQFFDAILGVEYDHPRTKEYLLLMRQHMPFKHAQFLKHIESTSQIRTCASMSKELSQAYKQCIDALIEFRNEHLKIVAIYIMKQAKKSGATAKGTGGTNPLAFLKSVRNQNDDLSKLHDH